MLENEQNWKKEWFLALQNNDIDSLRCISYSEFFDINELTDQNGNLSLFRAAINQQYSLCEFLLSEKGASISVCDKYGRTPLIEMIRFRSSKWNNKLVRLFAPIVNKQDLEGKTALMFASTGAGLFGSKRGNLKIIKQLLDIGADITIQDRWGYTALGHAIASNNKSKTQNNYEVVNFLKEEHLKITAKNYFERNYKHTFNDNGIIEIENR